MRLPEVWWCFPPVLEHFHSDLSSCSNNLKLLHFSPRVFHDPCLTCLPLTHTLAMLNSPSEHNSCFLALCAFAAPLLSETSPVSPPGEFIIQLKWQLGTGHCYVTDAPRHLIPQQSFMTTILPLSAYSFPHPRLTGVPWGQSSRPDERVWNYGIVQRAETRNDEEPSPPTPPELRSKWREENSWDLVRGTAVGQGLPPSGQTQLEVRGQWSLDMPWPGWRRDGRGTGTGQPLVPSTLWAAWVNTGYATVIYEHVFIYNSHFKNSNVKIYLYKCIKYEIFY